MNRMKTLSVLLTFTMILGISSCISQKRSGREVMTRASEERALIANEPRVIAPQGSRFNSEEYKRIDEN